MNHDGMHFFPLGQRRAANRAGLLVVNHEYVDQILLNADGASPMMAAKVAKALAAHGVTVIAVRRAAACGARSTRRSTGASRGPRPSPSSGRFPPTTPNCSRTTRRWGRSTTAPTGSPPWGTYLACEENWNGYFGTADAAWTPTHAEARYGVTRAGFGYNWQQADPRFDLAVNRKELNRFGWVVESIRSTRTPVKRTALGRTKHEGAIVVEHDGRVVVYSGDDENGDYLYKFVGDGPWRRHRARGTSPLDHGTLHVAKFAADGTGVVAAGGMGRRATYAGRRVDRPGRSLAPHPAGGGRPRCHQARPARAGRRPPAHQRRVRHAHQWHPWAHAGEPPGQQHLRPHPPPHRSRRRGAHRVLLDVFAYAGDPGYQPEGQLVPAGQPLFGSPDGIWVDDDGRMWIETDISNSSQNLASKKYDRIGNNQMLAADPGTGEIRRFLTGPRGCEISGVITTPDQETMFVNVEHPGESTTAF